jgi:hypothetical protein
MDGRSLAGEETVEEAILASGFEQLQACAAGEAPLRPAIGTREGAVITNAARYLGEVRGGVLDAALGNRDVIEADRDRSVQLSGGWNSSRPGT